jgi:hypothetical protein
MYGFETTALPPPARRLAQALAAGLLPEPVPVPGAPLRVDEVAFAVMTLAGWRCVGQRECTYERRAVLVGGPLLATACAVASAIGNRGRRHRKQREAFPQWRPLGALRVVVTDSRLLIWHAGTWWSVWVSTIASMTFDAQAGYADLVFACDPPYRLAGPEIDHLVVFLLWRREILCGE